MFAKVAITFALVCAFFGTSTAFDVYVDPVMCAEACPAYYNPVCGSNGQYYQEFSNDCELRAHNCHVQRSLMKPYEPVHLDMCRTELVNGLDKLMSKLGNLNMNKPECMRPCSKIYAPVCISNGKYRSLAANECIVGIINCALGRNQTPFKPIREDSC